MVPGVGVARASDARRRSHPRWAPPRLNFLLKIQVPAFDSSRSAITKKGHLAMPVFVIVPGVGVEPTRSCEQRILSPSRLPFRHPGISSLDDSGRRGLFQHRNAAFRFGMMNVC